MSSSNCCFLTCIQISQEADQVVWYSHLLKSFPQFFVIHTVKRFGIVNKAEVNVLSGTLLLFPWSSRCWQFDFWFLCLFQTCWHIECSTFTASSFGIWNSSTGIPSPPLALFIVMLPKAHLTSHSRMSGTRSVITPPWLSGSWRSFLYSSSVYSCYIFLISSAC